MALFDFDSHPVLSLALSAVGLYLIYFVLKVAYNVSPLHPLGHIPGPWWAAASYLAEFYYDVIKDGRYTWQIQAMHQKYGPIVRINPDELHCNDVGFIDEIYAVGGRKRNKPQHQVNGSPIDIAEFATADHDLHRARRAPVARFFSRANVSRLGPEIKKLVSQLCNKLLAQRKSGPFDLAVAYSCFTTDVISGYSFGQNFGLLDQPGWKPNFHDPLLSAVKPAMVFRFMPFLKHLTEAGVLFVDYLPEEVSLLVRTLQIKLPELIRKTKADLDAGLIPNKGRPTIFAELYQTDELGDDQKTVKRLAAEALAIVGAGTETTSWTLAVITYHLLTQPDILQRLTKELRDAQVDPMNLPDWTELNKLPYLAVVIQEGIRLSYGVSSRTARVATQEDLHYHGRWNKRAHDLFIPRGYGVGMSSTILHHDENIYPDSHRFAPERWIPGSKLHTPDVERAMFSFSKGSRACLGMNLAFCELNLVLAALVLRVLPSMRLFETGEKDVRYHHDMFIPMVEPGSKGIRVEIV